MWSTAVNTSVTTTTFTFTWDSSNRCVAAVLEYSGIQDLGESSVFPSSAANTSGSNANPQSSLSTQDNDNWIIFDFIREGTAVPTSNIGTLRLAAASSGGGPASNCSLAVVDNTVASPATVTGAITVAAGNWAGDCMEFRSILPTAPSSVPNALMQVGVGI